MADNPRIEELRRRVQTDPASIAFAQLAEEYRRAGNFDEAVRVCRAGLERHSSYLSARVTLGRALLELQQYDDARTELEYVLRSAPENLAAIRGLAEIHQRRGDLSEALRQFQTALGIARHDPELEESVHDLSRQLGGQPVPAPAARPSPALARPEPWDRPSAEPPPAGDEGEPRSSATSPPATSPFETSPSEASPFETSPFETSPSDTSLSPELEAAADEFTKALQALDALGINLPEEEDASPLDSAVEDAASPLVSGEAAEQQPAVSADVAPVDDSASEAEERRANLDSSIVSELEAWLEAIVLDRSEREKRVSQGPDLPVNTP